MKISWDWKEFNRKIELGREVNKIMDKHGYNENMLDNDMKEALKTYKLYGKTEDDIGTNEEQISCIDEELEKSVSAQMDEFDRKMELGRKLDKIMDKHGYNENGLNNDMMVALKTYKLHGKNMDMKDIEWRGWQMDLRQYLDKPCDRKVIWVVGNDGNEGKSFFQENNREEFAYS